MIGTKSGDCHVALVVMGRDPVVNEAVTCHFQIFMGQEQIVMTKYIDHQAQRTTIF